jgi:hypothetical protein
MEDIDRIEHGVRFISRGNKVLAVPLVKYKSFHDIEGWQNKVESQKWIQTLLSFPQEKKGVFFMADIDKIFLNETELIRSAFVGLVGPVPEKKFLTFIQCPYCGLVCFGFYYPGVFVLQEYLSSFYSKEDCYLRNKCEKHGGQYKFRQPGEKLTLPKHLARYLKK